MVGTLILKLFRILFKLVETISPALAVKWAIKLWLTPPPHKSSQFERSLMENASKRKVRFKESRYTRHTQAYYTEYSWGEGPSVLLVHGWGGRGSQMAHLAKPLITAGYRVITFDALAHGESTLKQTDIFEMSEIIKEIALSTNGFHAIVSHSLGGMVTAIALKDGLKTNKLVTSAPSATIHYYFKQFAKQTNASQRTINSLMEFIENEFEMKLDEMSLATIISKLDTPGLIIHDKDDKIIHYTESIALSKSWPNSELVFTERLGHRGILRNSEIIAKIVNFIGNNKSNVPRHT